MPASTTPIRDAVLVRVLNDAYGKEKQLETALQAQIAAATRPQLKQGYKDHLKVTKQQAKALERRIKQLGGKAELGPDLPGPGVAEAAAKATSIANKALAAAKGPLQALRGTSPSDNDIRSVRDALWNEAEEIAHYDVIETLATELGDADTAKLAREHRKEEEKMQRLLQRQLAPLAKAIVKDEVPREERTAAKPARRRTPAKRSTTTTRSGTRSTRAKAKAA